MQNKEVVNLLKKYKAGTCTEREKSILESWYLSGNPEAINELSPAEFSADLLIIADGLPLKEAVSRPLWPRMAVAVAVLVAVLTIWLFVKQEKASLPHFVNKSADKIIPGGNKATLTLASGQVVNLSDRKSGVNVSESGIVYSDGDLLENLSPSPVIQMLTASTPRGGMYEFVLPDGSKVMLNAATKLKFPSSFAGGSRREVELVSGEAFFEVTKDRGHPFVVKNRQQEIEVLGTQFNVNSYDEENYIKTTLEEGSVKVSNINKQGYAVLRPGQQSLNDNQRIEIKNVELETELAWKNGMFAFERQDFKTMMRAISRWYDVEVVFDYDPGDLKLRVQLPRSTSIYEMVKYLQNTGEIKFKIEGRRINVIR